MSNTFAAPGTTPGVVREATVSWLTHPPGGRARIEAGSWGFGALPVSSPEGSPVPHEATPGELLAVTQAMFVTTALAESLAAAGCPANELVTHAVCTFVGDRPHRELAGVELIVRGRVPGIDSEAFQAHVERAWPTALRAAGLKETLDAKLSAALAEPYRPDQVLVAAHTRRR
jgi:lipoyl-dependent peroxiredoxin